ncbi:MULTISPECIES: hypothetical protein [Legionella]|uniref:Uncharacterized protein n=1 Tax=Legionella maceachernii TaxID=466 RepID=A0A0W0VWT6_9GAMM|nr:hypothetical protein [Legionella maceachernii]KTD24565.1 hypothetical protein Lmac_2652 [Legionella maceachernii]SJZ62622.1 hypothetical protein SAMN02745128_00643 [Legionella maceachernii]SUP00995.1 Uncharacterised protein [Legionella maceachernii]
MSDIFEEDDDLVEGDVFAASLDEDVDIDIPEEIYTMDARRRLENKLDDMRLEAELKDDFDDY